MAVKKRLPQRTGRRVSLTRPGSKGGGNRSTNREEKKSASFKLPLQGLGKSLSAVGFIFVLLFFLGGVSVSLIYGYRFLTTSNYFSLTTLEIQGNFRLTSREILESADLTEGVNTLALSIDDVEEAVASNPWVQEVSVKRVLPGTLVIRIQEKQPSFWVLHDNSLHYADAWGRIIAPVVPGKFASLPTLEVEQGAQDAIAALPDLVRSLQESHLPINMASVSLVRLSAARGFEVYVDDARIKISVGLEDWLSNLQRLSITLADLERRGELSSVREVKAQGVNVWVEKKTGKATSG